MELQGNTNIGKTFKEALEKHIPRGHPLYPVINIHNTKLSYSTMPCMASKIGSQNNKLEKNNIQQETCRECDCPKTRGALSLNVDGMDSA